VRRGDAGRTVSLGRANRRRTLTTTPFPEYLSADRQAGARESILVRKRCQERGRNVSDTFSAAFQRVVVVHAIRHAFGLSHGEGFPDHAETAHVNEAQETIVYAVQPLYLASDIKTIRKEYAGW
jgi:hypothetical protein